MLSICIISGAPESVHDWVRFRNCRNSDMQLDESRKDALMDLLLTERRKVVDLFEKMAFVQERWMRGGSVQVSRLTEDELKIDDWKQQALCKGKTKAQAAAAAAMDVLKLAAPAKKQPDDQDKAAIEALLELSRAAPAKQASRMQDVRVLLKCLERLALDG
jgi:hypothetical protein